jgi:hypothetical protein
MLQEFISYVKTSEAATYAFFFSAVTPMVYMAPKYLGSVIKWVYNRLLFHIEIHFSDCAYPCTNKWLHDNLEHFLFLRTYRIDSKELGKSRYNGLLLADNGDTEGRLKWNMVPSYGTSILRKKGLPLIIFNRKKEEGKKDIRVPPDILKFTTFFWQKPKLEALFKDIETDYQKSTRDTARIYLSSGDYFNELGTTSSVYNLELLSPESKKIMADLQAFIDNKEWYKKRGLKYKRGYLLHGVPGTGKSSLIMILAHTFKMPLYIIRGIDFLTEVGSLMSSVPSGGMIVVEDIDTIQLGKRNLKNLTSNDKMTIKEVDKTGLTEEKQIGLAMGEIFNSLDGLLSYEGSVFIATTNAIESLDVGLLRPGRIDVCQEIKPLQKDLIEKVFTNFYALDEAVCYTGEPITIAKLQSTLLSNIDSKENAAKELGIS